MSTDTAYTVRQLLPFVGWRIVSVFSQGRMPQIAIRNPNNDEDHAILVIQEDAEGNGPGWVEVIRT